MAESLGATCHKCGADEWNRRKNGWRYCAACNRRASAERADLNGGALKLFEKAKARAKDGDLNFNITVQDIEAAWPADGKCPVLGIELKRGKGSSQDASPTLDRVNPEWGYVRDNIAVISNRANRMKNNARASELERIATWMRSRGLD